MIRPNLAVLVALLFSVLAAPIPCPCLAASEEADVEALVKGNTAFGLDLYQRLREQKGDLFFSPYSISTALAMTYAGARGNTAAQMADVLHFDAVAEHLHPAFSQLIRQLNAQGSKGRYQLSVANALWGQSGAGFLKEFLDLTRAHYGAGLKEVDFAGAAEQARQTINAWVEKETQGKITELIPPHILNALTELVLTNAIYFKGTWASQFPKEATRDAPFTLAGGEEVDVPMMHQTDNFGYTEGEGFQALELPYAGDDLSMVILLPADRRVGGLAALEPQLTLDNLQSWLAALRRQRVKVALPRFTLEYGFMVNDVLMSLGMTDAFSLPPADFSGMNGRKDLFISAVIHKAFVDVNEEGTEAAAATAVVMMKTAVPRPPVVFRADHPFIFLIRDNRSGSILFIGRLMNPRA